MQSKNGWCSSSTGQVAAAEGGEGTEGRPSSDSCLERLALDAVESSAGHRAGVWSLWNWWQQRRGGQGPVLGACRWECAGPWTSFAPSSIAMLQGGLFGALLSTNLFAIVVDSIWWYPWPHRLPCWEAELSGVSYKAPLPAWRHRSTSQRPHHLRPSHWALGFHHMNVGGTHSDHSSLCFLFFLLLKSQLC